MDGEGEYEHWTAILDCKTRTSSRKAGSRKAIDEILVLCG